MAILEKVFQRNDKVFLQLYFFIIGIFLYLCSFLAYYLGSGTFKFPEIYSTGSILIVIIFWISGLIRLKENRYIIGTVQFLRNEFVLLIQTFLVAIIITAILKITGNYSRVWMITTFTLSFVVMIKIDSITKYFSNTLFSSIMYLYFPPI